MADETPTDAVAAPAPSLASKIPGSTLTEKIDALHSVHIRGSKITTDVESWNIVSAFTADIKALVAEVEAAAQAALLL